MQKIPLWKWRSSFGIRQARPISNQHKKVNFYDVLQVHPKSTQREIKTAYYKLSMQYHPDRNKSLEAQEHFRNITEAYEILGNQESREKYDLSHITTIGTAQSENRANQNWEAYNYEELKKKPRYTGRTPIYNFDEFYKMHYSESVQQDYYRKKRYEYYAARRAQYEKTNKDLKSRLYVFDAVALFVIFWFIVCGAIIQDNDHDKVREPKNSKS